VDADPRAELHDTFYTETLRNGVERNVPLDLKTRIDLYEGAMRAGGRAEADIVDLRKEGPFVVRQWDGMVGAWTDCTGSVNAEEALTYWERATDGGTKGISFRNDIDYYRIFEANTVMLWSEGREMYR